METGSTYKDPLPESIADYHKGVRELVTIFNNAKDFTALLRSRKDFTTLPRPCTIRLKTLRLQFLTAYEGNL